MTQRAEVKTGMANTENIDPSTQIGIVDESMCTESGKMSGQEIEFLDSDGNGWGVCTLKSDGRPLQWDGVGTDWRTYPSGGGGTYIPNSRSVNDSQYEDDGNDFEPPVDWDDYWDSVYEDIYDSPNDCYGDCFDMDNDGRTWNDVDADQDGLYETP